jgi:DNA repair ATPase RecN
LHPLELQLKDLKEQIDSKDRKLKHLEHILKSLSSQLEDVKSMLHPSRQKYVETMVANLNNSLGF